MNKLSLPEAIRNGARNTSQSVVYLHLFENGVVTKTCALGAAAFANGLQRKGGGLNADDGIYQQLRNLYPELELVSAQCPVCREFNIPLQDLIMHLNDTEHWTREAIADWVSDLSMPTLMTLDLTPAVTARVEVD